MELVKGRRGEFTVVADGRELWNKHDRGAFPEEGEILQELGAG